MAAAACCPLAILSIERKAIDDACFRTETEGDPAGRISRIYDTRASPPWTAPLDERPPSLLQRAAGEQAAVRSPHANTSPGLTHDFSRIQVRAYSASANIQPKLSVNAPGDKYEQEADRNADRVMRMAEPQLERTPCACGGGGCPGCQTQEQGHQRLRARHAGAGDRGQAEAPPIVHEVLRSTGQPVDPAARGFMEARFGYDFSRVRVHADEKAAESARAVNARAYTLGQHLVFGAGEYQPASEPGRRLLAHELTNVTQQGSTASVLQR